MSAALPNTPPNTSQATVIGAGPAGLMAAERMALGGLAVTVFDRMPSPARKLLMAGVGGLNITHDEPLDSFLDHYGPARAALAPAIAAFPPAALRDWCAALGQPTFTGSSGRVFPVAMKASPLLRAWLARLAAAGVRFQPRHRWLGWDAAGAPVFDPPAAAAGPVVLALGGASWPRLGSDGAWVRALPPGLVAPLRPANCGFTTAWSEHFRSRFEGTPLKRITLAFAGRTIPGEATITAGGIEGGPFYALAAPLRDAIDAAGQATARLDLRPDLPAAELARRLAQPRRGQSLATFLRKAAGLSPVAIGLLRECAGTPEDLAGAIKALPLRLTGTTGLARAISTAGGVRLAALDGWMLRPGVFAAGEMLDWEAPTGGYLLQAAFSTGFAAGEAGAGLATIQSLPAFNRCVSRVQYGIEVIDDINRSSRLLPQSVRDETPITRRRPIPLLPHEAVMKLYYSRLSRIAYFAAAITLLVIGTARHATAAGIAATLDADPQFSDFVTELKFAGLWPAMERATNVTVFAPTNRAFDKTGSGWRAEIQSEINFQANGRGFAWQQTLLGTVITGVHSTDEFTGKAQFVHSIGSTVYWVDGRTGAAIHVQDKAPAEIGIVATPKRAELSLPPIMTSSGLIYPMDTIIR